MEADADAVEGEEEADSKFSVAVGSAFPRPGETMEECQISLSEQL